MLRQAQTFTIKTDGALQVMYTKGDQADFRLHEVLLIDSFNRVAETAAVTALRVRV